MKRKLRPVIPIFAQGWIDGEVPERTRTSLCSTPGTNGVLREYGTLTRGVCVIPSLSSKKHATLPCAAVTAWHASRFRKLEAGEAFLTLGTARFNIRLQLADGFGERVIATPSSDEKAER